MRFGATDAFAQAVVLSLYDPDRSQTVLRDGQIDTWESFAPTCARLEEAQARRRRGLRLLTETVVSPTLADQLRQTARKVSECRLASIRADQPRQQSCGQPTGVRQDDAADLPRRAGRRDPVARCRFPGRRAAANCRRGGFRTAAKGRVSNDGQLAPLAMNRLYVVESSATLTGAAADHRLPLGPAAIGEFALRLAVAWRRDRRRRARVGGGDER